MVQFGFSSRADSSGCRPARCLAWRSAVAAESNGPRQLPLLVRLPPCCLEDEHDSEPDLGCAGDRYHDISAGAQRGILARRVRGMCFGSLCQQAAEMGWRPSTTGANRAPGPSTSAATRSCSPRKWPTSSAREPMHSPRCPNRFQVPAGPNRDHSAAERSAGATGRRLSRQCRLRCAALCHRSRFRHLLCE